MSDTNNRKNRTHLSKMLRNGCGINSRVDADGIPIAYKAVVDPNTDDEIVSFLPSFTTGEDSFTPFNLQCNCRGACAVKRIIVDGTETLVLFADGDRVCVKRHEGDKEDPVTAILWALGKKVFGEKLSSQINRAIKRRSVTIEKLRKEKAEAKKAAEEAKKQVIAD